MGAFLINLAFAFVWMMLNPTPSLFQFIVGFVIGFIILIPYASFLKGDVYVKKTRGTVYFLLFFIITFIKANLIVAYTILFVPKDQIYPKLIDYDTSDLNLLETIILSQFITLTPGTITVRILTEEKKMIIHCMNAPDVEQIFTLIDKKIKKSILRVTR